MKKCNTMSFLLSTLRVVFTIVFLSPSSTNWMIAIGVVNGQTCSSNTRTDLLGPFYFGNINRTTLLAPINEINDPLKRLEIVGRVFSTKNCVDGKKYYPISNVLIEAWYAGTPDETGEMYQPDQYRGKMITNKCGYYSFIQSFPELYTTRPIYHTHFRLANSTNNKEYLITQMYFRGTGNGYYTVGSGRDLQAVTVRTRADGSRRARFNIFLNIPGNKKCQPMVP
jgi:protocatechuate 3,4-dioxygenase beta subunit